MIKIKNADVVGWEAAIRGMRNPLNSWEKSDSLFDIKLVPDCGGNIHRGGHDIHGLGRWASFKWDENEENHIGDNDKDLMKRLCKAGTDHRKFMRMITVYVDITAPLYWWKEFDTYKVGTVTNSCSTMHNIHAKEFTLDDFSHEHLVDCSADRQLYLSAMITDDDPAVYEKPTGMWGFGPLDILEVTINDLNLYRDLYLQTKNKVYWWQMIQLLPSSYNQKRTIMLNYEVLANMYKSRKDHKLDEWVSLCEWIKTLPYAELITGEFEE